jgi:hypothetical protein
MCSIALRRSVEEIDSSREVPREVPIRNFAEFFDHSISAFHAGSGASAGSVSTIW